MYGKNKNRLAYSFSLLGGLCGHEACDERQRALNPYLPLSEACAGREAPMNRGQGIRSPGTLGRGNRNRRIQTSHSLSP